MGHSPELTPTVVDEVSLVRALQDAEAANLRVVALTRNLLESEERVAKLEAEIVALKRLIGPRLRAEHVFRKNHALYVVARRARRMMGR